MNKGGFMRILLVLMLFASIASADVWLILDGDEITSLSPMDDAQLEAGQTKVVLPIELKDIELQYHPTYYKFKDGRFIVNIKKLSDEALAQEVALEKQAENLLINKKIKDLAITALEVEDGIKLKHNKKEK